MGYFSVRIITSLSLKYCQYIIYMEANKRHYRSKFDLWVRIIALILAIAFLWQDIVWAQPDIGRINTATLAQPTIPTTEDKAVSFQRFATAYINNKLQENPHDSTLSTVSDMLEHINDIALKQGLHKEDLPNIIDNKLDGEIRIAFPSGEELVFYNPRVSSHILAQAPAPPGEIVADVEINNYLREQFLIPEVPSATYVKPKEYQFTFSLARKWLRGDGLPDTYAPLIIKRNDGETDVIADAKLMVEVYSLPERHFKINIHLNASAKQSMGFMMLKPQDSFDKALKVARKGFAGRVESYFNDQYPVDLAQKLCEIIAKKTDEYLNEIKGNYPESGKEKSLEKSQQLPKERRFGKITDRKLRKEGYRYYITQGRKNRYFRFRWNIFASLHRQIEWEIDASRNTKEAEGIYKSLRHLLTNARSWAERTNSNMAEKAKSIDAETLYSLAGRDEIKKPENEPEFEGLAPLVWATIREIEKGEEGDTEKINRNLRIVEREIEKANFLSEFLAGFENAYFDARYSGENESSKERVFRKTWLKYLKENNIVRGSPAYWHARFYRNAFFHLTIPDPEKPSERIVNPLFKASTVLLKILKIHNFDFILKPRSFLTETSFPKTRALIEGFKEKKKSIYDLSQKDRRSVVRALADDMNLERKDLIKLNKCAEAFFTPKPHRKTRMRGGFLALPALPERTAIIRFITPLYFLIYRILRYIGRTYRFLPVDSSDMMSLVYTPGIAKISKKVAKDESKFEKFVCIQNNPYNPMWIVTDGSAVLGLGNIGAKAGAPVMEGKQALLKWFGNVKANILLVDTSEEWAREDLNAVSEKITETVKKEIKDKHGDVLIMLEDIAAPVCFDVERAINDEGIPTIHDDQHGTAITLVAGVIKALEKARKKFEEARIVISGAGASAIAVARLLNAIGVGEIICFDRKGVISSERGDLDIPKNLAKKKLIEDGIVLADYSGDTKGALKGADGYIGLSQPKLLWGREEEMLSDMKEGSFVFACSNPEPEFNLLKIQKLQKQGKLKNIKFLGCGRYGLPGVTTLNNCYAFPGLYRALIDLLKEGKITKGFKPYDILAMSEAAARALASLTSEKELSENLVLTHTFTEGEYNFEITQKVATAVYEEISGGKAPDKYAKLAEKIRRRHERLLKTHDWPTRKLIDFLTNRPRIETRTPHPSKPPVSASIKQLLMLDDEKAAAIARYYDRMVKEGYITRTKEMEGGLHRFSASETQVLSAVARVFLKGKKVKKILDLGSGNGKAAAFFSLFADEVTGYELDKPLVAEGKMCLEDLASKKVINLDKITVHNEDFFKADFSDYDFIYIYWPYPQWAEEEPTKNLVDKLLAEMKSDTIFVLNCRHHHEIREFDRLKKIDLPYAELDMHRKVAAYRKPKPRGVGAAHYDDAAFEEDKIDRYNIEAMGIPRAFLVHVEELYFEILPSLEGVCVGSQQLVRSIILERVFQLQKGGRLNKENMSLFKKELEDKIIPGIKALEALYKDTCPVGVEIHLNLKEYKEEWLNTIQERLRFLTDIPAITPLRSSSVDGEHLEARMHPGFLPITNLNILYYIKLGIIKPTYIPRHINGQIAALFPCYHTSIQGMLESQTTPLLALGYNLGFGLEEPDELRKEPPSSEDTLEYPGAYNYVGVTYDIYTGEELDCGQTNIFTQGSMGFINRQTGLSKLTYPKDLELNTYFATAILAYLKEEDSELKEIYKEFRNKLARCLTYLGLGDKSIKCILGDSYSYPPDLTYKFDTDYLINATMSLKEAIKKSEKEGKDLDPLTKLIAGTTNKIKDTLFKDSRSKEIAESIITGRMKIDDIIPRLIKSLYEGTPEESEKARELLEKAGGSLAEKALAPYKPKPRETEDDYDPNKDILGGQDETTGELIRKINEEIENLEEFEKVTPKKLNEIKKMLRELEKSGERSLADALREKIKKHVRKLEIERMEEFLDAIEKGEFQDRNIVDLTKLPPDKEIILVGDLHGRLDNLKKILSHREVIFINGKRAIGPSILERIENETTVLVILGDIIHQVPYKKHTDDTTPELTKKEDAEIKKRLADPDSSFDIMKRIMELKIGNPDYVYPLLGDHDNCFIPCEKFGVNQTEIYLDAMRERYGDEYVKLNEEFVKLSPIILLTNGLVAAHAGPTEVLSLEEIRNIKKDDPRLYSFFLERFEDDLHPDTSYTRDDVIDFLVMLGQPEAKFIVGHFPRMIPPGSFYKELMRNHYVIYAARDATGYAVFKEGNIKVVEATEPPQPTKPIKTIDELKKIEIGLTGSISIPSDDRNLISEASWILASGILKHIRLEKNLEGALLVAIQNAQHNNRYSKDKKIIIDWQIQSEKVKIDVIDEAKKVAEENGLAPIQGMVEDFRIEDLEDKDKKTVGTRCSFAIRGEREEEPHRPRFSTLGGMWIGEKFENEKIIDLSKQIENEKDSHKKNLLVIDLYDRTKALLDEGDIATLKEVLKSVISDLKSNTEYFKRLGKDIVESKNDELIKHFCDVVVEIDYDESLLDPILNIIASDVYRTMPLVNYLIKGILDKGYIKDPEEYLIPLEHVINNVTYEANFALVNQLGLLIAGGYNGTGGSGQTDEIRVRTRYLVYGNMPDHWIGLFGRIRGIIHRRDSIESLYLLWRTLLFFRTNNPEMLRTRDPEDPVLLREKDKRFTEFAFPDEIVENVKNNTDPHLTEKNILQEHKIMKLLFRKIARQRGISNPKDIPTSILFEFSDEELKEISDEIYEETGRKITCAKDEHAYPLANLIWSFRYYAQRYNMLTDVEGILDNISRKKNIMYKDWIYIFKPSSAMAPEDNPLFNAIKAQKTDYVTILAELANVRDRLLKKFLAQGEYDPEAEVNALWEAESQVATEGPEAYSYVYRDRKLNFYFIDSFLKLLEERYIKEALSENYAELNEKNIEDVLRVFHQIVRILYNKTLAGLSALDYAEYLEHSSLTYLQLKDIIHLIERDLADTRNYFYRAVKERVNKLENGEPALQASKNLIRKIIDFAEEKIDEDVSDVYPDKKKDRKEASPPTDVYHFGNRLTEGELTVLDGVKEHFVGDKGKSIIRRAVLREEIAPAKIAPGYIFSPKEPEKKDGMITEPSLRETGGHMAKNAVENMPRLEQYLRDSGDHCSGRKFGDVNNPLLMCVRSGAIFPMPGQMLTIGNVGINEEIVRNGLTRMYGRWTAWDSYCRFLRDWGMVFCGIDHSVFDEIMDRHKTEHGKTRKTELSWNEMGKIALEYKKVIEDKGYAVPDDVYEQLKRIVETVWRSWGYRGDEKYDKYPAPQHRRNVLDVSDNWPGTTVIIQTMIFGNSKNKDGNYGSGVLYSRDPDTGELGIKGDFAPGVQGADLAEGIAEPESPEFVESIEALKQRRPELYRNLKKIATELENCYRMPVKIEFTVEKNEIFILQVAGLKIGEGEFNTFYCKDRFTPVAKGIGASGGAFRGVVVYGNIRDMHMINEKIRSFDIKIEENRLDGVIFIFDDICPGDVNIICPKDEDIREVCKAILSKKGKRSSHAIDMARDLKIVGVTDTDRLRYDKERKIWFLGDEILNEGDIVSLDGKSGDVYRGRLIINEELKRGDSPLTARDIPTLLDIIEDTDPAIHRGDEIINLAAEALDRIPDPYQGSGPASNGKRLIINGVYFRPRFTLKRIADALRVDYKNKNPDGPDGLTLSNGLILLAEGIGISTFTHELTHAIIATIYSDEETRALVDNVAYILPAGKLKLGISENLRDLLDIPYTNMFRILNETLATLAQLEAKEILRSLTKEEKTLLGKLKTELKLTDYIEGFGYNSDIPELQALRKKIDEIHDINVTSDDILAIASSGKEEKKARQKVSDHMALRDTKEAIWMNLPDELRKHLEKAEKYYDDDLFVFAEQEYRLVKRFAGDMPVQERAKIIKRAEIRINTCTQEIKKFVKNKKRLAIKVIDGNKILDEEITEAIIGDLLGQKIQVIDNTLTELADSFIATTFTLTSENLINLRMKLHIFHVDLTDDMFTKKERELFKDSIDRIRHKMEERIKDFILEIEKNFKIVDAADGRTVVIKDSIANLPPLGREIITIIKKMKKENKGITWRTIAREMGCKKNEIEKCERDYPIIKKIREKAILSLPLRRKPRPRGVGAAYYDDAAFEEKIPQDILKQIKNKPLGRKVSILRTKWKKWSIRELAEEADLATPTVFNIEKRKIKPGIKTVEKLADAFRVEINVLIPGEPVRDPQKILAEIRKTIKILVEHEKTRPPIKLEEIPEEILERIKDKPLGEKIRILREEHKGWSIGELSRRSLVSETAINRIEKGLVKTQPHYETIEDIALTLGVKINILVPKNLQESLLAVPPRGIDEDEITREIEEEDSLPGPTITEIDMLKEAEAYLAHGVRYRTTDEFGRKNKQYVWSDQKYRQAIISANYAKNHEAATEEIIQRAEEIISEAEKGIEKCSIAIKKNVDLNQGIETETAKESLMKLLDEKIEVVDHLTAGLKPIDIIQKGNLRKLALTLSKFCADLIFKAVQDTDKEGVAIGFIREARQDMASRVTLYINEFAQKLGIGPVPYKDILLMVTNEFNKIKDAEKTPLLTSQQIEKNTEEIISRLVNTLVILMDERQIKGEKVVLLLDMPAAESQKVKDLINDHVIKPLQRINGNNGVLGGKLKDLVVADRNDIKNIKHRISLTKTLKDENVIILTNKSNLDNFKEFKNSFITAIDLSRLNGSQGFDWESYYYPYVEAAFFAVLRTLASLARDENEMKEYQGHLWKLYTKIPNVEKMNEKAFIDRYFDEDGSPEKIIILQLIPEAKKFDINAIYRTIEEFIRNA